MRRNLQWTAAAMFFAVGCASSSPVDAPESATPAVVEPAPLAAPESTPSSPPPSTASSVPSTDIYVGELLARGDAFAISGVRRLTTHQGYDNQPHFLADGASLLFTSVRGGQADIYRIAVGTGEEVAVTQTPSNEYSPTVLGDGASISVVRELGGVQQLWRYGLDGRDMGQLFPALDRIGYHAWLGPDWAAFFLVGSETVEHTLITARAPGHDTELIVEGAGRCIAKIPGENAVSFVRPGSEEGAAATIMRFDLETKAITPIVDARPGAEDYAWAPDKSLYMGQDAGLFRWSPSTAWQGVPLEPAPGQGTLAGVPSRPISRIAVAPRGDRIALVEVVSKPE